MFKIPYLHNKIGRGVLVFSDNLIPSSIDDSSNPKSLVRKNIIFLFELLFTKIILFLNTQVTLSFYLKPISLQMEPYLKEKTKFF